jgi:uncharacterized protein
MEGLLMKPINRKLCLIIVFLVLIGSMATAQPDDLSGLWEGRLEYPGFSMTIGFRIADADSDSLQVTYFSPDLTAEEQAIEQVIWNPPHLTLRFKQLHAEFNGVFYPETRTLTGEWQNPIKSQPLVLNPVDAFSRLERPQTPVPPFPYCSEDVLITNSSANCSLVGTLSLPNTESPVPGVVLVSGVGGQDRDYTVFGHRFFLVIADHLTRNGFGVLRIDDRGIGESTGERTGATSADYADDLLAAIAFMTGHPSIDPSAVGAVGHSEGGTIATLAAAQSSEIRFIVLLGTPGQPGIETNCQFEASVGRSLGHSEQEIAAQQQLQKDIITIIINEKDESILRYKLSAPFASLEPPIPKSQIDVAINRFLSPWFRFNLLYNPHVTLVDIGCPVLALFGELDRQVPPDANQEAMQRAFESTNHTDFTIQVLDQLNHFFQTATTGSPVEYRKITETISPVALTMISDWLADRFPVDDEGLD